MDLVMSEIFYLFCCSLSMGAFGILTIPYPVNHVVLDGTTDVNITCRSSTDGNLIKWSFIPVGSPDSKTIKDGDRIMDTDAFYGRVGLQPGDKCDKCFYDLFVKTASSSTAGIYKCYEDKRWTSALLVVLSREPSCDYTPKVTNQLPCNSTLKLSCTVSYTANTTLIYPDLIWSSSTEDLLDAVETNSTSGTITTTTSTLDVTWPNDEGDMPIYECNITFRLFVSAPTDVNRKRTYHYYKHTFKPFASTNDVPCKWTKRTTQRQSTVTAMTHNSTTKKGVAKAKEDSSVRSAETNNLAILVLGVAGVLLLAQML